MAADSRLAGSRFAADARMSEGEDGIGSEKTYRKTMAWLSDRWPSLSQARSAMSSAPAMALPALPPSGPLVDDV